MKIAIVVDKVYPYFNGGYERALYEISIILSKDNDLTIFTSLDHKNETIGHIQFIKISPSSLQKRKNDRFLIHSFIFSLSLFSNFRKISESDVILIEAIPYFHLFLLKRSLAKSKRLIVFWVNEAWYSYSDSHSLYAKLKTLLVRLLLKKGLEVSNLSVVGNTSTYNSLMNNYKVPPSKLLLLPHGLNLSNLIRGKKEEDKDFDLIFIGRLVWFKRVEDIILAVNYLKQKRGLSLKTIIVGDGKTFKRLELLVKSLKLEGLVTLTGYVEDKTKYELLSKSRIFVLPSLREGLSISTLEAMASGLPCIVAKPQNPEVFGPLDIIRDGYNGLYFKPGNIEDLSNKIEKLLQDHELLRTFTNNSTYEVEKYDWRNVANIFLKQIMKTKEELNL